MSWQDFVLTGGSIIFILALIPTVLGKEKPALSTSVITGIVLLIYAFVQSTLSLWFTSVSSVVTGLVWLFLAFQKYKLDKRESQKLI
ncbi:MAG: hypothetical protein M1150_01685 [Patescibacteria group bacterium]|nr:hypothetical protein [Patescibacteria group bacterium]